MDGSGVQIPSSQKQQNQQQQKNLIKLQQNQQDFKNGDGLGQGNNPGANDENDPITRASNKLKFHVTSFGFPDPGNFRSSKKKDIRARIKCMAAMLKQRQKDLEYRQQYDGKMQKLL